LEINADNTYDLVPSGQLTAGQNHGVKGTNTALIRYFETTITNQNLIQTEIKGRLILAFIQPKPKISSAVYKDKNLNIHATTSPVVLFGCET
jgi:hypothetical protein